MAPWRGRSRAEISVRDHEGEKPVEKWKVAQKIAQGFSYAAAGKELRRGPATIQASACRLGFSGRSALYDLGKPVTGADVARLKRASGLSVNEFAATVGLPPAKLGDLIRSKRWADRVQRETARKITEWRDGRLRALLSDPARSSRGIDRVSGATILRAFVPNLRDRYKLLLRLLQFLRRRASAVSPESLGTALCAETMLEVARRSRGGLFSRFLPWAAADPVLVDFLQQNLGSVVGRGNLFALAYKAIAQRWSTTPHAVAAALKPSRRVAAPSEMRRLLLAISALPGKLAQETTPLEERSGYKVAQEVQRVLPLFEKLCADMAALPKRVRSNPERALRLLDGRPYTARQIEAAAHAPGTPIRAARWFVSIDRRMSYGSVAVYHRQFR